MDEAGIRNAVVDAILEIAPKADFDHVDPARPLREQLELDSFDFLNLNLLKPTTGAWIRSTGWWRTCCTGSAALRNRNELRAHLTIVAGTPQANDGRPAHAP